MSKIKRIFAREILDSRGNPTIETTVILSDETTGRSSVPSGASRGTYEALELRDTDSDRYSGMGVSKAISNVNELIGPSLVGMDAFEQQKIDRHMIEMDGTQNKGKLGANAILSTSQAIIKAAARSSLLPVSLYIRQFTSSKNLGKKLPIPMFNMLEGGKHGGNSLNFQEFLVIPASSKTYSESLEIGVSIYRSLKKMLFEKSESVLNADEGGFSPDLSTNREGLILIKEAIGQSGFSLSLDVFTGIDAAANSFLDGKVYRLRDRAIPFNTDDITELYQGLIAEFSLIYLEDPLAEDDWDGWKKLFSKIGDKILVIGDDLVTTNPYRLQLALDNKVVGGIVIKPNQIGTITEAIAVSEIARYTGLKIVVSHRSGETEDSFIADFAVGIGADYVKFGAPARERAVKYNKLLEIEYELEKI